MNKFRLSAILIEYLAIFIIPTVALGFTPDTLDTNDKAFVHLFEWKWKNVAKECEEFLGPKGYYAVQISPAQEHIDRPEWWARYQPVSYRLESRGGTREEFIQMVKRCRQAGVKVYADMVHNHMTSGNGVGVGGTPYEKFSYPNYSRKDFHVSCSINTYQDRWQVQSCDLVGLADLKTESEEVRQQIANYYNDLLTIGVEGFRIDAAKHIPTDDITAILSKVQGTPFLYQEVINIGEEPIKPGEYFKNGWVSEFNYGAKIAEVFYNGKLSWLDHFGEVWGLLPSEKAIVFLDNHDNQRGHGGNVTVLTHKNGRQYALGNIFMLSWPYGYPQVMSSYYFTDPNSGPPPAGDCTNQWACEHRWPVIANMVAFRKFTGASKVENWWSNGENLISFSRGDKGHVVINKENYAVNQEFQTGMAPGAYCNVIKGDFLPSTNNCSGPLITVKSNGKALFNIEAQDAAAIHIGAKIN
ncbi:MAG: alpha-amylase family protein [Pseudomonadota bacterium]